VYGIVKQHKGWVAVESELDKGTSFNIFFPATPRPPEKAEPQQPHQPKMRVGTETILLVEDEPDVRGLGRLILQRLGYQVLEAESGLKALDVWEREKANINLLISDIVMPDGMTGRDLATKLQAEKQSLKVIFCSGYSREMVGEFSILQEGVNFLQKPYTPQKLAQIVRECLDRRSL
jgi:CheY-like chemotaxis protein